MNKQLFWSGFSIFFVEVLGILIYLISTLNLDWLTDGFILKVILIACIGLFNIFAFVCLIVGILSNSNNQKGGSDKK